jgi:hypothetical protein
MNSPSASPSLGKREPLTVDEILWFVEHAEPQVGSQMRGHAQYVARFALEQIWAVKTFERSSSRLTKWLIGLTGALLVLTAALTYFTIILARRG